MSELFSRRGDRLVRTQFGRLMGRLRRFPDHRYIGIRDAMRVYDCDDDGQFDALVARSAEVGTRNVFQAFGPDTLVEARSRGFRSAADARDNRPITSPHGHQGL